MASAGWVQGVRARGRVNRRSPSIDSIRDCNIVCQPSPRRSNTWVAGSDTWVTESLSKYRLEASPTEHWFVQSTWFKAAAAVVVVANALQMGMSLDLRGGTWDEIWQFTEYVFAFLFGFEMVLKLFFLRLDYFRDPWNLLEFVLAWLAICDAVIITFGFTTGPTAKITVLRFLRLARVLRTVRLFGIFKELVVLVEAIMKSMRTMLWLLLLVGLLLYVHAIFCVEMIGSEKSYPGYNTENLDYVLEGFNNYEYFGSILRSMHTLFNMATLNEWSIITRPIAQEQPWLLFILVAFTMLTAYGVMNVLIGVMVEHALAANANFITSKELEHKAGQMRLIDIVATLLTQADANGDGCITLAEFEDAINSNGTLAHLLSQVDLPDGCTIKELFLLIDEDGDATINRNEFVAAMTRLLYCDEFHRLCLMQMSLNGMKSFMRDIMREVKLLREDSSKETDKSVFRGNGGQPSENDEPEHTEESVRKDGGIASVPCAKLDGVAMAHGELQKMRSEIGVRLADLNSLWARMTKLGDAQPLQLSQHSSCPVQPPTSAGLLPPAFASEAKGPCRRICQPEAARSSTELPGMVPLSQDEGATCRTVAAPPRPDAISIISELEAKVAELQWYSELDLSSRKRDLECQAAMRICCWRLMSCLGLGRPGRGDPCSPASDAMRTRMSPALLRAKASCKETTKHAAFFRQTSEGSGYDASRAGLQAPCETRQQHRHCSWPRLRS